MIIVFVVDIVLLVSVDRVPALIPPLETITHLLRGDVPRDVPGLDVRVVVLGDALAAEPPRVQRHRMRRPERVLEQRFRARLELVRFL